MTQSNATHKTFDEIERNLGEILFSGNGAIPGNPAMRRVSGVFYKDKDSVICFHPAIILGLRAEKRNQVTIRSLSDMGFNYAKGHENSSTWSMFAHSIGRPTSCIPEYIEAYNKKCSDRKVARDSSWDDWEKVRDTFDGVVISVNKVIDYFDSGFTVHVLLSHVPYEKRLEVIKSQKTELLHYVLGELNKNRSFQMRVPSIGLYYPQTIYVFKSVAEAEIKFCLKRGLEDAVFAENETK